MALEEILVEPAEKLLNPPAEVTGNFFARTLKFWFSNRELKYAKKDIMDQYALQAFEEEIKAEYAKIPEEHLIPPRKALFLSALDAAEYYVEEEELRKMFARLIAATCDMRKASKVHPSFTGIIQQLSPLDAENLEYIFRKRRIPVLEMSDEYFMVIFIGKYKPDKQKFLLQMTSYEQLFRLGLVNSQSTEQTFDENEYESLYTVFEGKGEVHRKYAKPGAAELTLVGLDFCEVCLPEVEA